MPRPRKWKRVCCLPENNVFGQANHNLATSSIVVMKVEEYETIRLIDLEQLTQEESAEKMGVARATVQKLYQDARKKIAEYLIQGAILKIEGGDYKLYDEQERFRSGCGRHRRCHQNNVYKIEGEQ